MKTDKTYENYIDSIKVSFADEGIIYTKKELYTKYPKAEYMSEGVLQ